MKKKTGKILSGKGFYAALTLSVAMVGAACYFAYTQTSDDGFTDETEMPYNRAVTDAPEREAANIVTDITKPIVHTTRPSMVTRTYTTAVTASAVLQTEEAAAEQAEEVSSSKPSGKIQMPVDGGEVVCEYSGGELVRSKTTGAWQTHNGADIKAALGDSVTACDKGTVSAVENDPLWGVTVTIDHGNGIVTKYCGLNSDTAVQAGQEVSRGEEIGTVGNTADIESSEESHLHLEVMKNGAYVDPMEMM